MIYAIILDATHFLFRFFCQRIKNRSPKENQRQNSTYDQFSLEKMKKKNIENITTKGEKIGFFIIVGFVSFQSMSFALVLRRVRSSENGSTMDMQR